MIPTNYDYINVYNSQMKPSTVHCSNTGLVNFFYRYLLQEAISVFKWDNMPETWPVNYIPFALFNFGYVAIVRTRKYGVIPLFCTLYGYNVFYQPNKVLIANPAIEGELDLTIGNECTIIKLMPDFGGANDLLTFYADMMALTAESAGINLINSKLSYIFLVDNKKSAETAKKMYDNIASGEPAVFVGNNDINKDTWNLLSQNVGQNYIADKNLSDLIKWKNMFLTQIGIPNANTDKKERMITDEVNANNVETKSLSSIWLDEMKKGVKETNDMFGLNLSVNLRFDDGGEPNE